MTQLCRSSQGHSTSPEGGCVIWGGIPFETRSFPSRHGGRNPVLRRRNSEGLRVDSRFRGNDCGLFATSLPREEGDGCYLRQKDRPAPPGPRLECLKQKQFRGQRAFEAHRDTLLH